jgi:hypothetical protein
MTHNILNLYEIVYEICDYLPYPEMMRYTSLFKFKDKIRSNFTLKSYVMKRLYKDNVNPEMFCKALAELDGVIFGSYPLQAILGEVWEGDIDVLYKDYDYMDSLLINNVNVKKKLLETFSGNIVPLEWFENGIYSLDLQTGVKTTQGFKYTSLIGSATVFKLNDKEIQLIYSYAKDHNTILNSIDFDFNKIYFDGDKVHVPKNINLMDLRETTYHYNDNIDHLEHYARSKEFRTYKLTKRITKYTKRGFKIKIINPPSDSS